MHSLINMDREGHPAYEFGPFRFDPKERLLLRHGESVSLTSKAFDVLLVLIQRNNQLVEKDALMAAVWGDSIVEEGNLTVAIYKIRKALGGVCGEQDHIQTVAKCGYRFVGEVREIQAEEKALELPKGDAHELLPAPEVPAGSGKGRSGRIFLVGWKAWMASLVGLVTLAGAVFFLVPYRNRDKGERIRSLAVLPFEPLNVRAEQKDLGLGLGDAIITRLWGTGQIVVRPMASVLKFNPSTANPLVVGRELGVDAILDGSIQISSKQVWVNVQLVRVWDGRLLWAGTFQSTIPQLFSLDREVAEKVVQEAPFSLSTMARLRLERPDTRNPKAYSLYLEGRDLFNQRTKADVKQSIRFFQQAVKQDPQYADAYSSLANAYVLLGSYGELPWRVYPSANDAAIKAVELDHSLAAVHVSLAMIAFHYEWDWPKAGQEFQRAIALNPEVPMVHAWYGAYLAATGRIPEALAQENMAKKLDPASPTVNTTVGRVMYCGREYDQAIKLDRQVIQLEPTFQRAYTRMAMAYLAKRSPEAAIREIEAAQRVARGNPGPDILGLLGYAQALSGDKSAAQTTIGNLVALSQRQYIPAFSIALIYTALGERNRAFKWLERSYQDHSGLMVYLKVDPLLAPIRSDPRFARLLRQMGLSRPAKAFYLRAVKTSAD
jgi:DNA-binding winged helix-turn-helix (wHTH) protein/TolB-like protein/tetratricopeptide (TPR) repeat protein